jgi:hypothetical protein
MSGRSEWARGGRGRVCHGRGVQQDPFGWVGQRGTVREKGRGCTSEGGSPDLPSHPTRSPSSCLLSPLSLSGGGLGKAGLNFGSLGFQLSTISMRFQMCIPGYFTNVIRAFSVIEGTALKVRRGGEGVRERGRVCACVCIWERGRWGIRAFSVMEGAALKVRRRRRRSDFTVRLETTGPIGLKEGGRGAVSQPAGRRSGFTVQGGRSEFTAFHTHICTLFLSFRHIYLHPHTWLPDTCAGRPGLLDRG